MQSRTTEHRHRFERRPRSPRDPYRMSHLPSRGRHARGDRKIKLSILMPVLNEERTIAAAVDAVLSAKYPCEIELIVVDDGSTDRTPDILSRLRDPRAVVQRHVRNLGKGAALQTAAATATGT